DAADVGVGDQRHDQHLQRRVAVHLGRRDVVQDFLVERLQVLRRDAQVGGGNPLPAGGVDHGEIERGVVGVQFDEQVVDFVEYFHGPGVAAIDLVDDDDRLEALGERLS